MKGMFDNVKFEGTVNLGAIIVALIQLISAIAVYFRVKAIILEKGIKLNWPKKQTPPAPLPTTQAAPSDQGAVPDQGAAPGQVDGTKNGSM